MDFSGFAKKIPKYIVRMLSKVYRSEGAGGAREAAELARRGAAGAPEADSMSGMLPVLSLPICIVIGGPERSLYQIHQFS